MRDRQESCIFLIKITTWADNSLGTPPNTLRDQSSSSSSKSHLCQSCAGSHSTPRSASAAAPFASRSDTVRESQSTVGDAAGPDCTLTPCVRGTARTLARRLPLPRQDQRGGKQPPRLEMSYCRRRPNRTSILVRAKVSVPYTGTATPPPRATSPRPGSAGLVTLETIASSFRTAATSTANAPTSAVVDDTYDFAMSCSQRYS